MFNNIRLACRSLRRRRALSAVIIVMLALGIGVTTALFSLFHHILVQPLPVPDPQRLVNFSAPGPRWGSMTCDLTGGCPLTFSYPMFRDLERRQTAFAGIAAHSFFPTNLAYGEQTVASSGMVVSGGYFPVLNLKPVLGRLIGPQDEPKLGESSVVVLSHGFWQKMFGGDRDVINKTLTVNGQPLMIIGVAPPGFVGTILGVKADVFVPLTMRWGVQPLAAQNQEDRRAYWLYIFARLKPNVSVAQTTAAINGLFGGILREFDRPLNQNMPDDVLREFLQQQISLRPGARGYSLIPETMGQGLMLLLGLTTLVLLIVCVNIANLLLARGASRAGEMAIRASIGASRSQLVSLLLTESTVLAVIGGILSMPVAKTALNIISRILPAQTSSQLDIQLSTTAMLFAAGVSLLTVLLFGLFPALQSTRSSPALVIKEHTAQSLGGRRIVRLRSALVTAQIALSMVLLVLAGLFTHSLINIARVNLGMQLDSVVSFTVSPRANGYSPERTMALFDRIEEELSAQPGVTAVTSASIPLIAGDSAGNSIEIGDFEPSGSTTVFRNEVSPSFFKTLSIPLLQGRDFTDADTPGAPKVAIVNDSFVRKFNLGRDAIGKRFSGYPYDNVRKIELEIVGVVADSAYSSVKDNVPAMYFQPRRQSERPGALAFYVRSGIDSDAMMLTIPSIIARIDRSLPVSNMTTMRRQVQDNVYLDRLITMLSAGFAGLATLLAAIGLYGVLAYNVAQRTREFGLRLALGAEPRTLRTLVLRQLSLMMLFGGIVGLAGAITLGRTTQALLFGLTGYDRWVLAAAAVVLSGVVLIAGYFPARRASRIAPMEALRYE